MDPSFLLALQCDVDAQAESLAAFDQRYFQMEAGPFQGSMATCDFGTGLVVSFETVNRRVMQLGSIPGGSVEVAMILGGEDPTNFKCATMAKHSAVLLRPGSEAVLHAGRDMHICLLSVSGFALDNLRRRFEFDPDEIAGDVILPAHQTTSLRGMVGKAYDRFSAQPDGISEREIKPFENAILATIAWSFGEQYSHLINDNSTPGRHTQFFAHALRLLERHLADDISPEWLAHRLAVSRRTLDTIFNSATGASPGHFIKLHRLSKLRAMLHDPSRMHESIGERAARCGIWQLGRMAGEYSDHFGVLPSQDRTN